MMKTLAGIFLKVNIDNLVEITEWFDAIASVSSKAFTGVSMLYNVQTFNFPYLGTKDGKKLVFQTKIQEGERLIDLEELKKLTYDNYKFNKLNKFL